MPYFESSLVLFLLVKLVSCTTNYALDTFCGRSNVRTHEMADDEVVILFGKTDVEQNVRECTLQFGPVSHARKMTTKIEFEAYSNSDCGVSLAALQSPRIGFDQEVSSLFNVSCGYKPGQAYYADATYNVRIILKKKQSGSFQYNFRLKVTLSEHGVTVESMSALLVACIILVICIPIIGVAVIAMRCYKLRRWSKRRRYSEGSSSLHEEMSMGATRYTDLISGDQTSTGYNQACILGSINADGRCTVCNRHHDDFAHVVDVDSEGVVQPTTHSGHSGHTSHTGHTSHGAHNNAVRHKNTAPSAQAASSHACILGSQGSDGRCTVCNRRHDDFAHVVDVSHDGMVQDTVHSDAHHDNNRNHLQLNTGEHQHTNGYTNSAHTGFPSHRHSGNHRNTQSAGPGGAGSRSVTSSSGGHHQTHHMNSGQEYLANSDDDDDIDVSGNDLIPPDYDLSPPSYDEAVNMPKPDLNSGGSVSGSASGGGVGAHQFDDTEIDPLYQNIDSFTPDNR